MSMSAQEIQQLLAQIQRIKAGGYGPNQPMQAAQQTTAIPQEQPPADMGPLAPPVDAMPQAPPQQASPMPMAPPRGVATGDDVRVNQLQQMLDARNNPQPAPQPHGFGNKLLQNWLQPIANGMLYGKDTGAVMNQQRQQQVQNQRAGTQDLMAQIQQIQQRQQQQADQARQQSADARAQAEEQRNAALFPLQQKKLEQDALPAPRNIDPNSKEGIAADIAKSQGAYHAPVPPRNIDPNSPEGIAADIAKSQGAYHADKPTPEPGSYVPLTDNEGRVVGAWNPKSGEFKPTPEAAKGARKSGISATERQQLGSLEGMIEDVSTIRGLAESNRNAIGVIDGRLSAAKRATVGETPEVNELFRLSDNLADMLLRARSGAQINEEEYNRLRTLVPNPRTPESKFFSDLDGFEKDLKRTLAKRSGNEGVNAEGAMPQGTTGSVAPEGTVISDAQGNKKVKRGGKWVPQ